MLPSIFQTLLPIARLLTAAAAYNNHIVTIVFIHLFDVLSHHSFAVTHFQNTAH